MNSLKSVDAYGLGLKGPITLHETLRSLITKFSESLRIASYPKSVNPSYLETRISKGQVSRTSMLNSQIDA